MQQRENGRSMAVFNEAMALLLAGAFAVKTAIAIEDSNPLFQVTDKDLFGIGVFLVLAGFIVVLNVFQFPFVTRLSDRLPRRAHSLILLLVPLILFIVIVAEYVIKIVEFASIPTIFFIGFILLLFVLAALIFTVFRDRQLIQNISALSIAFVYNLVAMYLIFSRFQDVRIILMFLAFSAAIVLLIMIRMFRNRKRQLRLGL